MRYRIHPAMRFRPEPTTEAWLHSIDDDDLGEAWMALDDDSKADLEQEFFQKLLTFFADRFTCMFRADLPFDEDRAAILSTIGTRKSTVVEQGTVLSGVLVPSVGIALPNASHLVTLEVCCNGDAVLTVHDGWTGAWIDIDEPLLAEIRTVVQDHFVS